MTGPLRMAGDALENDLIAAGGVWMALRDDLDPQVMTINGVATNVITVRLSFMKSRYRLTVERVPDDEETLG